MCILLDQSFYLKLIYINFHFRADKKLITLKLLEFYSSKFDCLPKNIVYKITIIDLVPLYSARLSVG